MLESNDVANYDDSRVVGFKKGDYVIVHSTIKGYVSMRHKQNGSIFIYELVQQLSKFGTKQQRNLEDIVRQTCFATSKHEISGVRASQLPEMTTTLRAPCRLVLKGNQWCSLI